MVDIAGQQESSFWHGRRENRRRLLGGANNLGGQIAYRAFLSGGRAFFALPLSCFFGVIRCSAEVCLCCGFGDGGWFRWGMRRCLDNRVGLEDCPFQVVFAGVVYQAAGQLCDDRA